MMPNTLWHELDVRDKPALVIAVMRCLVPDALLCLEGDLQHCTFPAVPIVSREPTGKLHRQTLHPMKDFLVLPLEAATIRSLEIQLLVPGRIPNDIEHIQIEKQNELQFGAYGNFECGCGAGPLVPEDLLESLVGRQVLRSYVRSEATRT